MDPSMIQLDSTTSYKYTYCASDSNFSAKRDYDN